MSKVKKKQKISYDFEANLIGNDFGLKLIGEFKIGVRRFRWDYAIQEIRVLIEIQGGIWSGGAHGRGTGIMRDMEKLNYAASHGWRCLQYTPQQFCDCVKVIEDLENCRLTYAG